MPLKNLKVKVGDKWGEKAMDVPSSREVAPSFSWPLRLLRRLFYNLINGNKTAIGGDFNSVDVNDKLLKNVKVNIRGNNNTLRAGASTRLTNVQIMIQGNDNKILIGDHCVCLGGTLWIEDNHCLISIGENTTIMGADLAATEDHSRIEIGKNSLLSYGIDMRTGDSHSIFDAKTGERINFAENIIIGEHVWLGAHVKVLKGVNIGKESIIGIASVVTNAVPSNCIAAGIPARIVRDSVTWAFERIPNGTRG